ncbi:(pine wood nematode) hypothetical protein [Aphelenchoides fujianensis]|nr:(pine wood nematode) hypothetical protein [Aphelenchoides fujianensis]
MLGLLLVLFALFLFHQFWWRRRNMPWGPTPWPVVGNMMAFATKERWEDIFYAWTKEYGPIYSYWLAWIPVVAVNDLETMHELFVKHGDDFADRAPTEAFDYAVRGGLYGIVESSGDLWREQRRFALKVFRDFGLSKNKMEARVLEELHTIFQNINKDISAGVDKHDFHKHTDIATGSLINCVVTGFRFTANGPEREKQFYYLKEVSEKIMLSFSNPLLLFTINSCTLSKLPLLRIPFDRVVKLQLEMRDYLEEVVDEKLRTIDYSADDFEPNDFIDAFLREKHKHDSKGEVSYFTKTQLLATILDLWFAGQETTSTTLTWGIAYLIVHADAQKKLQEELDNVIGGDRMVTGADKTELPYTQAVVMEIHRCANIIGQNLLRKTTRDVTIAGYELPKGTVVIPQISVPMVDPKHFPEPKRFNPDRFIDKDGSLLKAPALMPFSLGKRQCLGEGLARMEMFLFIANLFNQYQFLPGKEPPTLRKSVQGFSFSTAPYRCRVERRF